MLGSTWQQPIKVWGDFFPSGIALVHLSETTMKLPTSLRLVLTYIPTHTVSWWSIPSKHTACFPPQSCYTSLFPFENWPCGANNITKARHVLDKTWYKIWRKKKSKTGISPKSVFLQKCGFITKLQLRSRNKHKWWQMEACSGNENHMFQKTNGILIISVEYRFLLWVALPQGY